MSTYSQKNAAVRMHYMKAATDFVIANKGAYLPEFTGNMFESGYRGCVAYLGEYLSHAKKQSPEKDQKDTAFEQGICIELCKNAHNIMMAQDTLLTLDKKQIPSSLGENRTINLKNLNTLLSHTKETMKTVVRNSNEDATLFSGGIGMLQETLEQISKKPEERNYPCGPVADASIYTFDA